MLAEQARADVGTQAAMADDGSGLSLIEFAQAFAERVERDIMSVVGADEFQLCAFVSLPKVDHLIGRKIHVGLKNGRQAIEVVHRGEGGHVQRILGRTEGWGVGEVDLREVAHGAAEV